MKTLIIITLLLAAGPGLTQTVSITTEGTAAEAGPDNGTFSFSRIGSTTTSLTVHLSIAGTAVAADYTATGLAFAGTGPFIVIPADEAGFDLVITPNADNLSEGDETLAVTVRDDIGSYSVDPDNNSGTVTIADDPPVVSIEATDADAAELGPDAGTLTFARSGGDINASLTVHLSLGGSATSTDYAAAGISFAGTGPLITIAAAQPSFDLVVTPNPDTLTEGDETLQITIRDDIGTYAVDPANAMATVTIADDAPVVSILPTDPDAAELGPDPGTLTFARSGGDINASLTVHLSLGGSATSTDYAAAGISFAGTGPLITIAAAQPAFDLVVTPNPDTLTEGDETLQITVRDDIGTYAVDPANTMATVTIADDAPVVSVIAGDGQAAEFGNNPGTFIFTRSGGNTSVSLRVFITLSGTAESNDYVLSGPSGFTAQGQFVDLAANENSAEINIHPNADSDDAEGNETVVVSVRDDIGDYLVDVAGSATVTIADFVEIIFVSSFESLTLKDCSLDKTLATLPWRFFDQGAELLDLDTGLAWGRCGMSEYFDWSTKSCVEGGYQPILDWEAADALADFNAGLVGDNLGFDNWRWATKSEKQPLSLANCSGLLVRDPG